MSAIQSKTTKTISKCPLYKQCDADLSNLHVDTNYMNAYMDKWKGFEKEVKYPLFVKNDRLGYNKHGASVRTAKKAIQSGHLDTQIWQTVNAHKKVLYKTPKGMTMSRLDPHGYASQFVLDLDHSGFFSIEEIENYFTENNLPMPIHIIQTGQTSYHIVYRVDTDMDPVKGISVIEVILFAAYLFQIEDVETKSTDKILFSLAEYGIDRSYLNQHPSTHKFRVPGSAKIKATETFICKGKTYGGRLVQSHLWNMYKSHPSIQLLAGSIDVTDLFAPKEPVTEHHVKSLITQKPEVIRIETSQIPLTEDVVSQEQAVVHALENDYWKEFIPVFTEKFSSVLSKRYAKKYAAWICKNLTFLKRNQLYMSQLRLASELGITQTTVSRHLKELIKAGFLKITGEYIKGEIPRKYGVGDALMDVFQTQVYETLTEEYVNGGTNDQMLQDVRILVHAGVQKDDIVEFIKIKMSERPRHKQRREKEIDSAVDLWVDRTHKKLPLITNLNINKLFKMVRAI